jgi:hypothetical protein
MRFRAVVLFVLSVCLPVLTWGQESDTSLGDLARQTRRAKPSQPHANMTVTDEDATSLRGLGKLGLSACAGLTQSEAEDLLGAPLAFAPKQTSDGTGAGSCSYNTASPGTSLVVAVQPLVNRDGHNTWQDATQGAHTDTVAGAGEEAVRVTGRPGLNIRQGQAFLVVTVHSGVGDAPENLTREHALELKAGQKIVERLPRGDVAATSSLKTAAAAGGDTPAQMPFAGGMASQPAKSAQDAAKAEHDQCVANVNTDFDKRLQDQKSRRDYIPGEEIERFNQQRANAIRDCDATYANKSK